jgi:PAS domain S-box-containing protein
MVKHPGPAIDAERTPQGPAAISARQAFAARDWSKTPLGPVEQWSAVLRSHVDTLMANPSPMMLTWGEDLIQIYNDSYVDMLADKHPAAMGSPLRESWKETWEAIAPPMFDVLHHGMTRQFDDERYLLLRHGFLEETFFSFSISPVEETPGRIAGVLYTTRETTRSVYTRRRLSVLTALGKRSAGALTLEQVCTACREVFEAWRDELPAVICFLRGQRAERFEVFAVNGVDPSLLAEASLLDPLHAQSGTSLLEAVQTSGQATRVDGLAFLGLASPHLFPGASSMQGVLYPLRAQPDRPPIGVVFFALHPHRLFDEDYEDFLSLVSSHITVSIERARIYEAEARARLQTHQTLARLEANFEFLANALPLQVWTASADGRIDYVNEKIVEYFGRSVEEFLNWNWTSAIHPDHLSETLERWQQALRTGTLFEMHHRLQRHDGTWRWHIARALPQRDVQGNIIRWFGTTTDIEDLRRTQEALREAERLVALRSSLLANMSHEIRTPLTSMVAEASMLADQLPPMAREAAERIAQAGLKLSETLNSVLLLAQIEAGAIAPDVRTIDVGKEVSASVDALRHLATARGLDIEVDTHAAPTRARLDPSFLDRIVINLVGNAIKFTERGKIFIRVARDEQDIVLTVIDTGIGIDPVFIPEMFDEFKQESTGLARSHEGTGLGLAITRRLIEAMHGSISVESRKGKGATFTVRLPIVQGSDQAAGRPPERVPSVRLPRRQALPTPVRGAETSSNDSNPLPHLLVIEDNDEIRALIERLLRKLAHIDAFADAESAIEQAASRTYNLVLMDISLPRMSGVEALEQLRRLPAYRSIPVIALTGHAIPGDRERFLDLGFDQYLAKPFSPGALRDIVLSVATTDGTASSS